MFHTSTDSLELAALLAATAMPVYSPRDLALLRLPARASSRTSTTLEGLQGAVANSDTSGAASADDMVVRFVE